MSKVSSPRRGSLAFYPRKRAKRIYPRIKTKVLREGKDILAFAGYKAGMTRVLVKETITRQGESVVKTTIDHMIPVTIIECPPLFVIGVRLYKKTPYGLRCVRDILAKNLPRKYLLRKMHLPKEINHVLKDEDLENADEVRLIVCTQPWKIKLKKTPEVFEIPVSSKEVAKNYFGKEIRVSDVFNENEYVDVIAVTKGKGYQGVVKRFGVTIQTRKAHGYRRKVGSIGPWHPAKVMWTIPRPGQMGFHRRTEYNKLIMKISNAEKEDVTPKGGFVNYGVLRSDYIILKGSVPGPKKRLIILRPAIRDKKIPEYELKEIITYSQQ